MANTLHDPASPLADVVAPRTSAFKIIDGFMSSAWGDGMIAFGQSRLPEFGHGTRLPPEYLTSRAYQDHFDLRDYQLQPHAVPFLDRLREVLDACELGLPAFTPFSFEAMLAVRTEGQCFHWHTDYLGTGEPETRSLAFTYYAHSRPRRFMGGELEFLGGPRIEPLHDRLVLFDPHVVHRVRHVHFLPPLRVDPEWSADLRWGWAHARWSIAGWVHCFPDEARQESIAVPPDRCHPRLIEALAAAGEFH